MFAWAKAHEAERLRERCENAQKYRAGSIRTLWSTYPLIVLHHLWILGKPHVACTCHISCSTASCSHVGWHTSVPCKSQGHHNLSNSHGPNPQIKPRSVKLPTSNVGRRALQTNTKEVHLQVFILCSDVSYIKMYLKINILTNSPSSLQTSQNRPLNGIYYTVPYINKAMIT